jgi:hypothetical protein
VGVGAVDQARQFTTQVLRKNILLLSLFAIVSLIASVLSPYFVISYFLDNQKIINSHQMENAHESL